MKLQQAFYKTRNTDKSIVSRDFINSDIRCPEQEIIITIFSDRDYMEGMYSKLLYIKELTMVP